MRKVTINKILKKKGKEPIACLTSYTKAMTEILDKYCDIILVGDSVGMVFYGMKNTKNVTMENMILHGKAVKNAAKKSLVVVDMPYETYSNKFTAYKNALKLMKKTNCDAVKLEGGKNITNIIKYLVNRNIPVMGHVGLLPQTSKGFKIRGKRLIERKKILNDAKSVSQSGVFAIVIECVIESLAKEITNNVKVPTIGIGASKYCDGQILVIDDMIGMSNFTPRFVKQYSNVGKIIDKSVKNYCLDVRKKRFPFFKNIYK